MIKTEWKRCGGGAMPALTGATTAMKTENSETRNTWMTGQRAIKACTSYSTLVEDWLHGMLNNINLWKEKATEYFFLIKHRIQNLKRYFIIFIMCVFLKMTLLI